MTGERAQFLGFILSAAALIVALVVAGIAISRAAPTDCTPARQTETVNEVGYPYVVRTVMPEDLDR